MFNHEFALSPFPVFPFSTIALPPVRDHHPNPPPRTPHAVSSNHGTPPLLHHPQIFYPSRQPIPALPSQIPLLPWFRGNIPNPSAYTTQRTEGNISIVETFFWSDRQSDFQWLVLEILLKIELDLPKKCGTWNSFACWWRHKYPQIRASNRLPGGTS